MKLPGFLDKPRWQAKDAAVRRAAVAADDDAELLASLARIAREDPDAGVRIAAMKRLGDPALAQRAAESDPDAGVREEARRLRLDLYAGTSAHGPSPEECRRLLHAQDDAALIEHVARNAPDTELRAAALARVSRVSLLVERATRDPSPELRFSATERIDDADALDRLAERTRKSDKTVSRHARERADVLRIANGDARLAEEKARALCERLEQLARARSDESEHDIDTLWRLVEARVDERLKARYRAAHDLLATSREARSSTPAGDEAGIDAPPADAAVEADKAEPIAAAEPAATIDEGSGDSVVEPLIAQARFVASVSAANDGKQQDRVRRAAHIERVDAALNAFEAAIEAGSAARAHAAHAEIAKLRKQHGEAFTRGSARRLAHAEQRYAELSRWQHWSDNQRRKQLCEEVEALGASGLHPDAVATRVREAQAEWSRLDAAEGHAASQGGWARRFHAACRHALDPAKAYFRKRQELRKAEGDAVRSALDRARAITDDSEDWHSIAAARRDVVAGLRGLDRVDPHDRKTFAHELKLALKRLDALHDRHFAGVEQTKAALISEAEALRDSAPGAKDAVAAARALQQRWREAGNGRRSRDQQQWNRFRGALDGVFGKLDEQRAERAARDADANVRAATLCAELEQLAHGDDAPPRGAKARIEAEWNALNVRDEVLRRRFRSAQSALDEHAARRARATRLATYDGWLARYRLCRRAENALDSAEDLRRLWTSAPPTGIAADALQRRFEAALGGSDESSTPADDSDAPRRDALIRLEIVGGRESPPEDRERRRLLQIERLSARMRGAAAEAPEREIEDLLDLWTRAAACTPEIDERFERALAAAIDTLS